MSWSLMDLPFRMQQYASDAPLRGAQTFKALEDIPLTQAQTTLAGQEGEYYGAQSTKAQMEAEQIRIQNQVRQKALEKMGGGTSRHQMPQNYDYGSSQSDVGSSYPPSAPPSASPSAPPSAPTAPASSSLVPGANMPFGNGPARIPDAGGPGTSIPVNAMGNYSPASVQLAQANTGTMSDAGTPLYSPGYRPVAQPTYPNRPMPTGAIQLAQAQADTTTLPANQGTPPPAVQGAPPGTTVVAQAGQPGSTGLQRAAQGNYDPEGQSSEGDYIEGIGPVSKRMAFEYWNDIASGKSGGEAARSIMLQRYQRLAELVGGVRTGDQRGWDRALLTAWREGLITNDDWNTRRDHADQRDGYLTSLTTAAEQIQAQINRTNQGLEIGPRGNLQPSPMAGEGQAILGAGRVRGEGVIREVEEPDDPNNPTGSRHKVYMLPSEVGPKIGGGSGGGGGGGGGDGPRAFNTQGITEDQAWNAVKNNEGSGAGVQKATFDNYAHAGESYNNIAQREAVGQRYFDAMWKQNNGDIARTVTAYHGGPGRVAAANSPTPWTDNNWRDGNGVGHGEYFRRFAAQFPQNFRTASATPQTQGVQGGNLPMGGAATQGQQNANAITLGMDQARADRAGTSAAAMIPRSQFAGPGATPALTPPQGGSPNVQQAELRGPSTLGLPQQKDLEVETERRKQAIAAAAEEQKSQSKTLGDQFNKITTAGETADATRARLYDLQHAAEMFTTGTTAAAREAGWKAASTALRLLGIEPPAFMSSAVTGAEIINKEGNQLAQVLTSKLGSGEAATVFNSILAANPNMSLSKGGFKAVVDSYVQGIQRDRDLYGFMNTWLADPKHNNSLMGMLPAFQKEHPVETYASRVLPFDLPKQKSQAIPGVLYKAPDGTIGEWNGQSFRPQ